MRPLVAIRHARPFDPRLVLDRAALWAIEPAARFLAEWDDFPPVSALERVFSGERAVRFVEASPRPRRHRRGAIDPAALYDGRIAREGCVPTRARSWHDLMNALVWGTFPRAKHALHLRQHRAIAERLAPGARVLPPTRTPEQDALALIDEGGVVVLAEDPAGAAAAIRGRSEALHEMTRSGATRGVIFGHAVYESLVLGVAPAAVAAVVLRGEPCEARLTGEADAALSRALADPALFRAPHELCRVDVTALALAPEPTK